jgi:hypothetical protein
VSHPSIISARKISDVRLSFLLFAENNLLADKEEGVVAYHGAASHMKWIWRLTHLPDSIHEMPTKLRWFFNLLKIIKEYVSWKVHPKKSGLQSLSLGSVWSHLNDDAILEGAHDSLGDTRAQRSQSSQTMKFLGRTRYRSSRRSSNQSFPFRSHGSSWSQILTSRGRHPQEISILVLVAAARLDRCPP